MYIAVSRLVKPLKHIATILTPGEDKSSETQLHHSQW
jgi:hypothetical protein